MSLCVCGFLSKTLLNFHHSWVLRRSVWEIPGSLLTCWPSSSPFSLHQCSRQAQQMAIAVLLAPVKAGLGTLLSPTERWALQWGWGGWGWEAQSWCWISHLTASGLARPWADGQAGGGWYCLLMPNKQGYGSAWSLSTFSTEFNFDSRGRSVTFSVFLMTTQFSLATKPLRGRIVDTLTERFYAV